MTEKPTLPPRVATGLAYALIFGLVAGTVALVAVMPNVGAPTFGGSWWLGFPIAVGYLVAERLLFHIEFRREAISFSLSEVPTIFAIAFLGPIPAIAVRVGASVVGIYLGARPPAIKSVFNAALFAFETALAFAIVRQLIDPMSPDEGSFLVAAAVGTAVATVVGLLAVTLVISFFDGELFKNLRSVVSTNLFTATVGALTGAAAVAPALFGPLYGLLSLLPVIGVWGALQQHGKITQRHRELVDLHAFSRVLDSALQLDIIAPRALGEISRIVNADRVTLRLDSADGDTQQTWSLGREVHPDESQPNGRDSIDDGSFSVPLLADSRTIGTLAIAEPNRDGRFRQEDRDRAQDLAEQLGASIRNGLLHASVERTAMHDGLTGDPNRLAFEQRLQHELSEPRSDQLAVIVLDLNQFKEVNDTLGHHVGDQVLVEFAGRVRSVLGSNDMLSRFGGDEFAILLRRDHLGDTRAVAEEILTKSYTPLKLDGCDAVVTASIGIAYVGEFDTEPAGILRRADIAMYAAKNQRMGIEIYRDEIDRRTPARLSLLGDLRTAIERNELQVHFQPKIDLKTSTVVGAEALVRWEHAERGWIAPDDFIGVAEESGLIRLVTEVVLNKSIQRAATWHAAGHDLGVAVNLSALDLHDESLAERIGEQLQQHGLRANRLTLEITESALMVDTARTMRTIEALDLLGVRMSLDDFGTGYSSLSYLRRLPVAELKIDQSFVRDLLLNVNDDVIVRSTVDLGHNLGLLVVAEGIENQQVFDHLTSLGCDIGQGYGIARPLSPDRFDRWLGTTPYAIAHAGETVAEPHVETVSSLQRTPA